MPRGTVTSKRVTAEAAILAETDAAELVMVARPGGARLTRVAKAPSGPKPIDPRHLSEEGQRIIAAKANPLPVAIQPDPLPAPSEQAAIPQFLRYVPLRVKRLAPTAKLPERGSPKAIGYDCFAHLPESKYHPQQGVLLPPHSRKLIPLGIAIAVPPGCYGRIAPRSGLAFKQGVAMLAGVIDEDYRGEVNALLHNTSSTNSIRIIDGMRVCQLILERARIVPIEEVEELDDTERGEAGFGSTGA